MRDIKLKPEIKTRWLAALRSGDYTQGTGVLRKQSPGGVTHCCLGVLTEIATEDGIATRVSPDDTFGACIFIDGEGAQLSALPNSNRMTEWALEPLEDGELSPFALSHLEVRLAEDRSYHSLTGLNDRGDHSFADIADLIEEQL